MIALVRNDEEAIALRRAIRSASELFDECAVLFDARSMPQAANVLPKGVTWKRAPFLDFSSQRNAAAEMVSGEWVLILDADDEFANVGDLRECMEQADDDIDAIDCEEVTMDEAGRRLESGTMVVAYRRGRARWKYRGHNQLQGHVKVLRASALYLYRHATTKNAAQKAERTIALLMQDYEEDRTDPHAPFFLARANWLRNEIGEMQRWSRVCIGLVPASVSHSPAWMMDAMGTLDLEGLAAAQERAERGLRLHPEQPDLLWFVGFLHLARWMKSIQKGDANPYMRTHLTSTRYLPKFVEIAAEIGMPVRNAE